jgi:predicted DCC family thiol-disulfide oxidoreductase YuxK
MNTQDRPNHLVLYDGTCGFCDQTVQFILRNESERQFHFIPLQSDFAQEILAEHHMKADLSTVVYLEQNINQVEKLFTKSDAILQIACHLRKPYPFLAQIGLWVPSSIRNTVYRLIARIRYRIFGRVESCSIPTAEHRTRFLQDLN